MTFQLVILSLMLMKCSAADIALIVISA